MKDTDWNELSLNTAQVNSARKSAHSDEVALALAGLGLDLNRRNNDPNDRRQTVRRKFSNPIYLTDVGNDGKTPRGKSFVVIGKHLSNRGLDFYCHQPLPNRRMVASIQKPDGQWLHLLIQLTWCRFTKVGWYDNGGRFISLAAGPPNLQAHLT